MQEFRKCPFCGGPVTICTRHDDFYGDTHILFHDNNGAQILCVLFRGLTWNGSVEEFTTLWNRRADT